MATTWPGRGDDMTTKWQQHGDLRRSDDDIATTRRRHDEDVTKTWRRHGNDATLPPHRRHILAEIRSCGSCGNQCGGNVAAMSWQCGGDVVAMWRQCGGDVVATWHRSHVVAMSLSRPHHVVVVSSRCRRQFVVMSSWCRRRVVVMLAPCHRNVVAMSTPLPIRPAMDPPVPTRNLCPQAYRIYLKNNFVAQLWTLNHRPPKADFSCGPRTTQLRPATAEEKAVVTTPQTELLGIKERSKVISLSGRFTTKRCCSTGVWRSSDSSSQWDSWVLAAGGVTMGYHPQWMMRQSQVRLPLNPKSPVYQKPPTPWKKSSLVVHLLHQAMVLWDAG